MGALNNLLLLLLVLLLVVVLLLFTDQYGTKPVFSDRWPLGQLAL